eukprot:3347424-Pyramimonas_sp.AAC.1
MLSFACDRPASLEQENWMVSKRTAECGWVRCGSATRTIRTVAAFLPTDHEGAAEPIERPPLGAVDGSFHGKPQARDN